MTAWQIPEGLASSVSANCQQLCLQKLVALQEPEGLAPNFTLQISNKAKMWLTVHHTQCKTTKNLPQ
jgi:hypothetical protein